MKNKIVRLFVAMVGFFLVGSLTVVLGPKAFAAPGPNSSPANVVAPELGVHRSKLGFKLSASDSQWIQMKAPESTEFVSTIFRAPGDGKATKGTLTVRVDKLNKPVTLDRYVKRWMKEYPKYGFNVLGTQPFSQNKNKGIVIDLMNKENQRQIRQVVFVKDQKAVILTCRDQVSSFKASLKSCNQIVRTFQWE